MSYAFDASLFSLGFSTIPPVKNSFSVGWFPTKYAHRLVSRSVSTLGVVTVFGGRLPVRTIVTRLNQARRGVNRPTFSTYLNGTNGSRFTSIPLS